MQRRRGLRCGWIVAQDPCADSSNAVRSRTACGRSTPSTRRTHPQLRRAVRRGRAAEEPRLPRREAGLERRVEARLRGDHHVARFLRRCLVTRPIWSPASAKRAMKCASSRKSRNQQRSSNGADRAFGRGASAHPPVVGWAMTEKPNGRAGVLDCGCRLFPLPTSFRARGLESQRDSVLQPRVARTALPWEGPNNGHQPQRIA